MDPRILPAFRFAVSLLKSAEVTAGSQQLRADPPAGPSAGGDRLGDGGFQEVAGLEIEMETSDVQEGGRNAGVIRRVGRAKLQPLVLKRGMFFLPASPGGGAEADTTLWEWMQDVLAGVRPVRRYDGVVYVRSADDEVRATFAFDRGLPMKLKGPELNARTGEIAIEELTIAHEGLRIVPARGSRA